MGSPVSGSQNFSNIGIFNILLIFPDYFELKINWILPASDAQNIFFFPSEFCTKNQLKCDLHILHVEENLIYMEIYITNFYVIALLVKKESFFFLGFVFFFFD